MNYQKKLFAMMFVCLACMPCLAQQEKKPMVIFLPDDVWMKDNGFIEEKTDVDSSKQVFLRYADALRNHREMSSALLSLQNSFLERGFGVVNNETIINDSEANMSIGSLMNQLRPDFQVLVDFTVKETRRPLSDVTCNLKVLDAYTFDNITTISNTREMTSDPTSIALRKIFLGRSDQLIQEIIDYILDLRDNGRKINVRFTVAKGASIDYQEDDVNGQTLKDYLFQYLKKYTVNGALKNGRQRSTFCEFRDVRIPFFNSQGDLLDYQQWADDVMKALSTDLGKSIQKSKSSSLGSVNFILGGE